MRHGAEYRSTGSVVCIYTRVWSKRPSISVHFAVRDVLTNPTTDQIQSKTPTQVYSRKAITRFPPACKLTQRTQSVFAMFIPTEEQKHSYAKLKDEVFEQTIKIFEAGTSSWNLIKEVDGMKVYMNVVSMHD